MELLLGRVLAAIAAGSALAGSGCTTRQVTDEDGGQEGSDTGESAPTTGASDASDGEGPVTLSTGGPDPSTGTATTVSTSEGGGTTTDIVKYDLGPLPDQGDFPSMPPPECIDPAPPDFVCDVGVSPENILVYRCMDVPPGGCEAVDDVGVLRDAWQCAATCEGGFVDVACGPDPGELDACCYWLVWEEGHLCPGRPFVVDEEARLAPTQVRGDWRARIAPEVSGLDARMRATLAAGWLEHARYEHASVASFARFVLQLLAVGAPARLVASAQTAMREELQHARTFYAFASAYAGRDLGPGPLPIEGCLSVTDLRRVTLATVGEGCIAETISALQIAFAAERARNPAVRRALRSIAEEELRHAELAWAFVRWALERGDAALRRDVARTFRDAAAYVPAGPDDEGGATLVDHGLLPRTVRLELAARALDGVIGPAMGALLAASVRAEVGVGSRTNA